MIEIPLTQGKFAIIDKEDYPFVSLFNWCAEKKRNTFYASTTIVINNKLTSIFMHRLLANATKKQQVDHKNGNGLDNRKSVNLRLCTHSQNLMNQQKQQRVTTSKYKGVRWHKKNKRWEAYIQINNKQKHLGQFYEEDAAGQAYNFVAKELFGEFARFNNI